MDFRQSADLAMQADMLEAAKAVQAGIMLLSSDGGFAESLAWCQSQGSVTISAADARSGRTSTTKRRQPLWTTTALSTAADLAVRWHTREDDTFLNEAFLSKQNLWIVQQSTGQSPPSQCWAVDCS